MSNGWKQKLCVISMGLSRTFGTAICFVLLFTGAAYSLWLQQNISNIILAITAVILVWYTEETKKIRIAAEEEMKLLRKQLDHHQVAYEESKKVQLAWAGNGRTNPDGTVSPKVVNTGACVSIVRICVQSSNNDTDTQDLEGLKSGDSLNIKLPSDTQQRFTFSYTDMTGIRWEELYRYDPKPNQGFTRESSAKMENHHQKIFVSSIQ